LQALDDWTDFAEQAIAHNVTPLVAAALSGLGSGAVPTEIDEALQIHTADLRAHNRELERVLLEIVAALERRGIPVLPFKGPLLARTLYGDLGLRVFRDLDFLIHEGDAENVLGILVSLGFRRLTLPPRRDAALRRVEGQSILFRGDPVVPVEPHWRFTPSNFAIRIDYEALWRRATTVEVNSVSLVNLAPEDQLLVLCVHGSKERWWRLNWISDVAELIRRTPALDWDATLARARSQACRRMILIGLALAHRVLGAPLPAEIQRIIVRDRAALTLADSSGIFAPSVRGPGSPANLDSYRFRMHDGLGARLVYAFRTITTPSDRHYAQIALPDHLVLAYYPLKIFHDYLLLPPWLLAKRASGHTEPSNPR
jgi:hypothetical protein